MSKFIFHFFAITNLLISCADKKPSHKVYVDFELGTSTNSILQTKNKLMGLNRLHEKDGIWFHIESSTLTGKKYYSTPTFKISEGDTINSMIRIIYFDDPKLTKNIFLDNKDGSSATTMYLSSKDPDETEPGLYIKQDILKRLEDKYGNCTLKHNSTIRGIYSETYYWDNTNGININLTYSLWKASEIQSAGIKLDFTLVLPQKQNIKDNTY